MCNGEKDHSLAYYSAENVGGSRAACLAQGDFPGTLADAEPERAEQSEEYYDQKENYSRAPQTHHGIAVVLVGGSDIFHAAQVCEISVS